MKAFACILFLLLCFDNAGAQRIPAVKITDVTEMIDTSSVPLIVTFWATWCGPCVKEIPYFEKHVNALKDKKVKIILVSLDFKSDYPKVLEKFVTKNNYSSQVVWLNETDADVFCTAIDPIWTGTIPVTLMVNRAKKYRAFFPHQLTEPRFKLELKKLLEE